MPKCSFIDPLVTPYVDGELPAADAQAVDEHLCACPPCRARISSEQAIHDLLRAQKPALQNDCAPEALRSTCAGLAKLRDRAARAIDRATQDGGRPAAARGLRWFGQLLPRQSQPRTPGRARPRFAPLALAATLVLIVGGAFLARTMQSSTRIMAAELTADHVKCFMLNAVLGTRHSPAAVESSMASGFGWQAHLPERPDEAGLELIGARPCLYGEGRVAHIMYRHNGRPVSVFMLPKKTRTEELVKVMGHEAAVWSNSERTFVLIAREPRAEVERIASYVHSTLR